MSGCAVFKGLCCSLCLCVERESIAVRLASFVKSAYRVCVEAGGGPLLAPLLSVLFRRLPDHRRGNAELCLEGSAEGGFGLVSHTMRYIADQRVGAP